jgi:hypothetical protein
VALFPKHGSPARIGKASVDEGEPIQLRAGLASVKGGGHLLQVGKGEDVGRAKVERSGAAMEGTTEIPGLSGSPVIEAAVRVEGAMHAMEGEAFEGSQPGKPVRGVRNQGQDALGGRNDDGRPVRPNVNQGENAGAGLRGLGARRGTRCVRGRLCGLWSLRGRGRRDGSLNGSRNLQRGGRPTHQDQGEFGNLSLQRDHLSLEERHQVAQIGDLGGGFPRKFSDRRGRNWDSRWRRGSLRSLEQETTIMEGCQLPELIAGETFDPSISRMQARWEMSGFEPATQCFRVNPELKATVCKGYKSHGDISFHSINEQTRKRRENGES